MYVSSRAAFFHRSCVSMRSTRAYTVLKSIGHAWRFDADRQNRESTRESSLSLSDFTDRSGLLAGKKQRDRGKRTKAVGVLGREMRGVKRAKADRSQGLPARRASINCSGVCVSNGDPGYVAHFLSLNTESVARERERERDACSCKQFLARESRVRYTKPVEVKKSSHESD